MATASFSRPFSMSGICTKIRAMAIARQLPHSQPQKAALAVVVRLFQ